MRPWSARPALLAAAISLAGWSVAACGDDGGEPAETTATIGECTSPAGLELTGKEQANAGLQTYVVTEEYSGQDRVDPSGVTRNCRAGGGFRPPGVDICFTADGVIVDGVAYARINPNEYISFDFSDPDVTWRNYLTFNSAGHVIRSEWDTLDGLGYLWCRTYTRVLSR